MKGLYGFNAQTEGGGGKYERINTIHKPNAWDILHETWKFQYMIAIPQTSNNQNGRCIGKSHMYNNGSKCDLVLNNNLLIWKSNESDVGRTGQKLQMTDLVCYENFRWNLSTLKKLKLIFVKKA